MPKLLAIEWDGREARVAVAQSRGKEIVLEDAFAVPLADVISGEAADSNGIGERIASALAARNVSRGEVLVSVGRASIELKQMSLPPAPEDELPDLVRFQAMRQFTTISNDWPLDFVPLQRDDSGTRVLAAAISPAMVEQIRATCKTCDLTPKRLALRPFAAASLLNRHDLANRLPPCLMVDILGDEADLTVLADKQVILMRTVRLPGASNSEAVQSKSIIGEIRRTIAAAQNQIQGRRIEKVVLCGNGSDQDTLKQLIEQELAYDVDFFDPFEVVRQQRSLADRRPEHAGRFAPLIGMLWDEAAGSGHAIDFLHPRRKPEPPSQNRRNVLIGAVVGTLALAAVFLVWFELSSRDREIRELTNLLNSRKKDVAEATARKRDLEAIQAFLDGDITWLEKLYDLCNESVPDPGDKSAAKPFLITSVVLNSLNSNGGEISVNGFARESSGIEELRNRIRRRGFEVIPGNNSEDQAQEEFPWGFNDRFRIKPARAQQ